MNNTRDNYDNNNSSVDKDDGNRKWKRHEFNEFLTKTGVSAALTNAMLELSQTEDRPADPKEFIRSRMRPVNKDVTEIEVYRKEIETLEMKAHKIQVENNWLLESKRRILKLFNENCDGEEMSS